MLPPTEKATYCSFRKREARLRMRKWARPREMKEEAVCLGGV